MAPGPRITRTTPNTVTNLHVAAASGPEAAECLVCSELALLVLFSPCQHRTVCEGECWGRLRGRGGQSWRPPVAANARCPPPRRVCAQDEEMHQVPGAHRQEAAPRWVRVVVGPRPRPSPAWSDSSRPACPPACRRLRGGGPCAPDRAASRAGGGAAEPLPADGGAHHLPHLHRQPHPPGVPVRTRCLCALRGGTQRVSHLPPAGARPHPDLRVNPPVRLPRAAASTRHSPPPSRPGASCVL